MKRLSELKPIPKLNLLKITVKTTNSAELEGGISLRGCHEKGVVVGEGGGDVRDGRHAHCSRVQKCGVWRSGGDACGGFAGNCFFCDRAEESAGPGPMVGLRTGDAPHEIVAPEANRQMVGLAAGAEREGRARAVPGGGGVRRKPTRG